ncbi:YncE family protein [Saccharopolyspora shandongensis]|uniref:YncE family protein n=1 Tax=Saccharopolyspora shandongensis TaxID=418495 RepID=UPI0033D1F230
MKAPWSAAPNLLRIKPWETAGPKPDGTARWLVVAAPDGKTAWVTEQGANTVSTLDISDGGLAPTGKITVGTHPNQAVLDKAGRRLFVANGDSDQVSVIDTASSTVASTISLAP